MRKMTGQSAVYKYRGKAFRYDYDDCIVRRVVRAGKQEIEDEQEWIEKYGHPLLDIDKDGYYEVAAVGLHIENWRNREARNEYLDGWIYEMEEESAQLVADFVKYELPNLA